MSELQGGAHKKFYARGYFDCLRDFGVDTQEFKSVNEARRSSLYNGMDGTTKKIYEAIPTHRSISTTEIVEQLKVAGVSVGASVTGCLSRMAAQKLIKEGPKGKFIKLAVKEKSKQIIPSKKIQKEHAVVIDGKEESALDIIEGLVTKAKTLEKYAADFRSEAEEAGLKIEEMFINSEKKSKNLMQLKALLKEI